MMPLIQEDGAPAESRGLSIPQFRCISVISSDWDSINPSNLEKGWFIRVNTPRIQMHFSYHLLQ